MIFSLAFIIPSFRNEGNSSKAAKQLVAGHLRFTTSTKDRYVAFVAEILTSILTCLTCMLAADHRVTLSTTTVQRRPHMNDLYTRVTQVWDPLSIQYKELRLMWCCQNRNWIVSDWGNVAFTDESKFVLKPDDKSLRV